METIAPMTILPSLAEARNRARQSMDLTRQGVHPTKMRKQQLVAEQVAAADAAFTLEPLIERFIDRKLG
jgi:hypothetical protein